ncbi:DUF2194 domain-containing protein [Faecalicatena contorta]|uniref:DUF2194 domain-containing protein n=1 Tax=Faecalicatena contorta TaxID=39482 RepID=A0A315ZZV2_9FIRM|nr:DUF2194 domain-containing protein [Faecalicatena contorta]PWJ49984.1 uncharacterized protein DUF2194 [Faecalicatena contorta]SUQ14105.1 hypothetical protein SAMN05216529_10579 [Faecalicatena contorta]
MLSVKRLCYVILIVLGICAIFMIYNLNENKTTAVSVWNEVDSVEELIQGEKVDKSQEPIFYIIGDREKNVYKDIFKNVEKMMKDMKVSYSIRDTIGTDEMRAGESVLIFCDDVINTHANLQEVSAFLENGGKAVFAAGLAEGYEDAYLNPVLGIVEKSIKGAHTEYVFRDGFFPVQRTEMTYDGFSASSFIRINDQAEIYVKEKEKGVPIVYSYPYGKGESLVINATLLDRIENMGFLTSGLGQLLEDFIYPVIGTKSVYLDNFPMVTHINDKVSMELYGRNTESFVRDVIWPVFQGMALRNDVKYTSSVLALSSKDEFLDINRSLFQMMGRAALKFDGELAYASNYKGSGSYYQNTQFIERFKKSFENYDIVSLVMMTDSAVPDAVKELGGSVQAVRGNLSQDNENERMAIDTEFWVFPKATSGADMENGGLMSITSVLASYGYLSHAIDINMLVDMNKNNPVWDDYQKQLGLFETEILRNTDYLEEAVLKETQNIINSYLSLTYTWKKTEDTIVIQADSFLDGQTFLYQTKGRVKEIDGAAYEEISKGWYMLKLHEKEAIIQLEHEVR